jgi:hypothetical protein
MTALVDVHGTYSRATLTGCPCDPCRAAASEYKRAWKARCRPEDAPHGTLGGYNNWGCRCPACTKAKSEYMRDYQRARSQRWRAS